MMDALRSAPSVARNTDPIVAALRSLLPQSGVVLEIASGSGEHALHFARAFPALSFQPSDHEDTALVSIAAWRNAHGPANLLPPLTLDVSGADWPSGPYDSILCINMVHISPWDATQGLMRGAARVLSKDAPLYLYGPYFQRSAPTAPSNLAFDESLRERDPRWGLRDLDDVADLAVSEGFRLDDILPMPANNLSVIFKRT